MHTMEDIGGVIDLAAKKEINYAYYTGERPLFHEKHLCVTGTTFGEGESPLKECADIRVVDSTFGWKYPLWYGTDIEVQNCTWEEMARAGVWYTNRITVADSVVNAPKNFRRCCGLTLRHVFLPMAEETLWNCQDVQISDVNAKGDYFAMNSSDIKVEHLNLVGNYCFDGAKNVEIHDSRLISKDAFWNAENVTVYDSVITGEYFGWNAKNLTLVNCTVESLQGMCYVENLVMKNCKLPNTTLAFEYSTVQAEITGRIDSVKNPSGGYIKADEIGELIMEKDKVQTDRTKICCPCIRRGGSNRCA